MRVLADISQGFAGPLIQRNLGDGQGQLAVGRLGAERAALLRLHHAVYARHVAQSSHKALIGGLAFWSGQRRLAVGHEQRHIGVFFAKFVAQQIGHAAAFGVGQAARSLGIQRSRSACRKRHAQQHQNKPEH